MVRNVIVTVILVSVGSKGLLRLSGKMNRFGLPHCTELAGQGKRGTEHQLLFKDRPIPRAHLDIPGLGICHIRAARAHGQGGAVES